MIAYILGAGSTLGTLQKLSAPPTSRKFGARLAADGLGAEFAVLEKVANHLERPLGELGLEEIWSTLDYFSKLSGALPIPTPWEGESLAIKQALLRCYGAACDRDAEKALPWESCTLGRLVMGMNPGDMLISFNYDTLAERLASRLCHHPLRMVGWSDDPSVVLLAKPHGSASWKLDPAKRSVTWHEPNGGPRLDSLSAPDEEPFVLGAVPIKSELLKEIQSAEIHGVVMKQWLGVVTAVCDCEHLVVLGYSFPPEDHYGRFLFREAILQRKKRPLRVTYHELPDQAAATAGAIASALGHAGLSITYAGPVTAVPLT